MPDPNLPLQVLFVQLGISADGRWVSAVRVRAYTFRVEPTDVVAIVFDRMTGTSVELALGQLPGQVRLSASGSSVVVHGRDGTLWRRVIASGSDTRRLALGFSSLVAASPRARYALFVDGLADLDLAMTTPLGFVPSNSSFSGDERWLATESATDTLVAGDTNGVSDVFVIDLPDLLDADDDTMDDRWETLFGVTDPAADPDGDGQTNAQEEDAGTHPNGQVRRFLAEGATGTFFHTAVSLANPSAAQAASAVLTFDRGDGTRVRLPVALPAGRSVTVDAGAVTGVEAADVSTTIESDRLVAVHRSMTWGSPGGAVYGSHAETATPSRRRRGS